MLRDAEFSEFASAVQGRALRLAFLLILDRDEAQDLVQDALVRIYLAWGRIRDPSRAEAYLRRTIVRLAADRGRRRTVATVPLEASHGGAQDPAESPALMGHEVVTLLRELPESQRVCLVLRFYADLSVDEVSEMLGRSPGTVKSQTHDAVRNFRARFAIKFHEGGAEL